MFAAAFLPAASVLSASRGQAAQLRWHVPRQSRVSARAAGAEAIGDGGCGLEGAPALATPAPAPPPWCVLVLRFVCLEPGVISASASHSRRRRAGRCGQWALALWPPRGALTRDSNQKPPSVRACHLCPRGLLGSELCFRVALFPLEDYGVSWVIQLVYYNC